jgi:hypothetical protein
VSVQIRDEDGDVTCGFKVRLATLKGSAPAAAAAGPKPPEGVLTSAEAMKKPGETVKVQFVVQSIGGKANLYLNSNKDFRAKDNFAVIVPVKAQKGTLAKADVEKLVGMTIRATGKVEVNKQGNATLEITDEKSLEIVKE